MGENVRVVVRCRPMNRREHEIKCRNILQIEDCVVSVLNPTDLDAPAKSFTYDSVYNELAPTEAIYNDVCYSLVENVLEGYNGTIFAYGQTGCGKTHTMQGPSKVSDGSTQMGITPRCFDHIFEAISVSNGVRYLALVSYLEIYNENIRDLLSANESNVNHALKDIPGVGISVPTLSSHAVINADECHKLLNIGNRNRMVGATLMNETSSRSHSIFTISLEQIQKKAADEDVDACGLETRKLFAGIRRGKLNLVDLAGSERQNKTGAAGSRLKEATKINLSLSALGNVISALVDGKTKHVPYRDSKLTRLLQDSLGGNTKTLMISCISPAENNYDETLSTLRYASRAKNISNKPKINEDPKDAKLREYHQEILKLKQLLDESQRQDGEAVRAKMREEIMHEEEVRQQRVEQLEQNKEKCQQQQEQTEVGAAQITENENDEAMQLQTRNRIEMIKRALIGGERANDVQLKNVLKKRKIDAERRLSALAHALSRVKESEDRNLLQVHYTSIQQELNAKNDYLKACRQKIRALEREVSDLQSEFQLDRADYLESIRRLERNLKFYQLLMNKALPILRKDGKYWEPQDILDKSSWNDDLKTWKLPETTMYSFKFPPPDLLHASYILGLKPLDQTESRCSRSSTAEQATKKTSAETFDKTADLLANDNKNSLISEVNKNDILNNYFRSTRSKLPDYIKQTKGFEAWKGFTQRNKIINNAKAFDNNNTDYLSVRILNPVITMPTDEDTTTQLSYQRHEHDDNYFNMNSTWGGGVFDNAIKLNPTNDPILRHSLNMEPRFKTGGNRKVNGIFQLQWQQDNLLTRQYLRGRRKLPKLEQIV